MQRGRVAVLGAGAWGTALAGVAARAGNAVVLWGRDAGAMAAMAEARENRRHLPGLAIDPGVQLSAGLAAAVEGADLVLAAVPSQALRSLLDQAAPLLPPAVPVLLCAKGLERGTALFLDAVARQCLPDNPLAVLSGPSFAADVCRGLPTAVTVAAATLGQAEALGARLGSPAFRLYHTDDVRGVEIGGAAKNVLAIACGIAAGRGLGASAVAALTARCFAELARLGERLGARPETLAGLSGLGDLVLTCGSPLSRNFSFGQRLGREGALRPEPGGPVVEGVWTAPVLAGLARLHGVDMPVAAAVAAVLGGDMDVGQAVEALLARPFRPERGA